MSATIMVVEDQSDVRQLIKDALDGNGYNLLMCNNALTAKEKLTETTPDLAIIDWMMPQVSGIELVRSMRQQEKTGTIPIIMLTARSTEDDTIEGLEAGADDFITKPFSPRELRSRARAALRRTQRQQQATLLSHGRVTLHLESLRVTVKSTDPTRTDQQVQLGQTEFNLLKLFFSQPERVFSREQLLDNVWGINHMVEERTVDVYILRLRTALKAHNIENIIDTVRGAGYRLASG